MPLTDLGIDPDTDLVDQYDFTKTTASDQVLIIQSMQKTLSLL